MGQPKGRVKVSLNLVFPFADFSIKQDKIETAPGTSRATTERKHITQKKSGWHECSLHSRLTSGFVWEFPQVLQVFTNSVKKYSAGITSHRAVMLLFPIIHLLPGGYFITSTIVTTEVGAPSCMKLYEVCSLISARNVGNIYPAPTLTSTCPTKAQLDFQPVNHASLASTLPHTSHNSFFLHHCSFTFITVSNSCSHVSYRHLSLHPQTLTQ